MGAFWASRFYNNMSRSASMKAQYWWIFLAILLVGGPARSDEASALATIEKLNGEVERAENEPGKPVVMVRLGGRKVTDDALKELSAFPELRTLYLPFSAITDAGLKDLK